MLRHERGCERVRSLLTEAVEATNPMLVLHGHWHVNVDRWHNGRRVVGFADGATAGALGLLEVSDGEMSLRVLDD